MLYKLALSYLGCEARGCSLSFGVMVFNRPITCMGGAVEYHIWESDA